MDVIRAGIDIIKMNLLTKPFIKAFYRCIEYIVIIGYSQREVAYMQYFCAVI